MDKRPILGREEFLNNNELTRKVINELKKQYNKMAKKNNGFFTLQMLEDVFKKTTKKLNLKDEPEIHLAEAVYDSFAGLIRMFGESGQAFKMLETTMTKGQD